MTKLSSANALTAALLTATIVLSALPAAAATIRPAPPRDPNSPTESRGCYNKDQVASYMQINLRYAGYYDTFRYRYYHNHGE